MEIGNLTEEEQKLILDKREKDANIKMEKAKLQMEKMKRLATLKEKYKDYSREDLLFRIEKYDALLLIEKAENRRIYYNSEDWRWDDDDDEYELRKVYKFVGKKMPCRW